MSSDLPLRAQQLDVPLTVVEARQVLDEGLAILIDRCPHVWGWALPIMRTRLLAKRIPLGGRRVPTRGNQYRDAAPGSPAGGEV